MDTRCFSDIYQRIENLQPTSEWKSDSLSICIVSSTTSSHPSLNLLVSKAAKRESIVFSVVGDYMIGLNLWTSKSIPFNSKDNNLANSRVISVLLMNVIQDVIGYASYKGSYPSKYPALEPRNGDLKDIFNYAFLSLSFLICMYEAPTDLRSGECLEAIHREMTGHQLKEASKSLVKFLGVNIEERWMQSMNLAMTNWIVELQASNNLSITPSPLFSYSLSPLGLWKIQLYCPVIAMENESSSSVTPDDKLSFSLKYHQLEGVIQLVYKITAQEKWVDVAVRIDNVRFDVVRLLNEGLMRERGAGTEEKHFPSRVSLHITPVAQTNVISLSVGKSSENPTTEIGHEKGIETSFEPPKPYIGINITATETVSVSMKPWKFEESVSGCTSVFNWFLHDSVNGREVASSKPSLRSLLNPRAWFKGRYSSAHRPFTRQGGVIFAGDEYGDTVRWRVEKSMLGKTLEWEIKGLVWLTYWPNRRKTLYTETKKLQFRDTVTLTVT